LRALGIRRLLLSIHDLSLPGDPSDDLGHGAPLSLGGRAFLRFAAALGFQGLQLGPQGETTPYDPSPYNATLFSRGTVSIGVGRLAEDGLLPGDAIAAAVASRPHGALLRASHAYAQAAMAHILTTAWQQHRGDREVQARMQQFVSGQGEWIERAGRGGQEIGAYRFGQWLAHEQHDAFRAEARGLGLRLWGDLQIGISHRDLVAYRSLLLPTLAMGAPPSRTNPEGQAWGYGVLDPELYGTPDAPGAALSFVRARAGKLLREYDGLRVDHPHGLIDPWVYLTSDPDPARAVQRGTRLFSSPERGELSRWAIARQEQIDGGEPPHGDRRVRALAPAQVERYAVLFDALVEAAKAAGSGVDELIPEVLSTQPYPVFRVLERHGLGRFRVTQKAAMDDPGDVYRAENARVEDWIMVGTHDTEPIWRVAERWLTSGAAPARAAYLAERLVADERERPRWVERTSASALGLARAELANLFAGPAANVMIFFSDLLGLREIYNRPGTVSAENWSLRVPPDFATQYPHAAREGRALHLPTALATAIRARGPSFVEAHRGLLERLEGHR
jgi:4-alpha-glucanotransferase